MRIRISTLWKKKLKQWLPITLILLLAAALYLYQLGKESLWIDEFISIEDTKNLGRSLQEPRVIARALFYILLRGWMILGGAGGLEDAWLRGMAVVFGLGCVFLTYWLGRRLIAEDVGLIAALVVACSPLFINHAQEVRYYTLSPFLGLVGTLALSHALESPTILPVCGWIGFRFLSIITTPFNVPLFLADILLIGWRFYNRRAALLLFGTGILALGILWLPFAIPSITEAAPEFLGQANAARVFEPKVSLFDIWYQLTRLTVWPFGKPNSEAIYSFYKAFAVLLACIVAIALWNAFKVLATKGLLFHAQTTQKSTSSTGTAQSAGSDNRFLPTTEQALHLSWLAVWTFLPLIFFLLVTLLFSRPVWKDRYLLLSCPYLFLILAAGWTGLRQKWRIGAIAIALIYSIAITGGIVRYYSVLDRGNLRGLVQTINSDVRSNDVVIWAYQPITSIVMNHYYNGPAPLSIKELPATIPDNENSDNENSDNENSDNQNPDNENPDNENPDNEKVVLEDWINSLPPVPSRLWLVYTLPPQDTEIFLNLLERRFQVQIDESFKTHREPAKLLLLVPKG